MPERKNDENIFIETLEWICKKLEKADIPYMITGGSAVGFWGHIRTTMDIDIIILPQLKKLDLFLKSVKDEAYVDIDSAKKIVMGKEMFNIIYNKTCFKVDLIPLKRTLYETVKFNNRVKLNLGQKEIFVIKPEDLIISKLLWTKSAGGSERQLKDCESIYKLNYKNLDMNYLKKWADELNLNDELEKIKS